MFLAKLIFQFSHSYFPIQVMACKEVNCAECLTRLALTNNVRGVQRYLTNVDRSVPVEPLISILLSAFTRFISRVTTISMRSPKWATTCWPSPPTKSICHSRHWLLLHRITASHGHMKYTHFIGRYYSVIGSLLRLSPWFSRQVSSIQAHINSRSSGDIRILANIWRCTTSAPALMSIHWISSSCSSKHPFITGSPIWSVRAT